MLVLPAEMRGNHGGGEWDRRATTAAVSGHDGKSSGDWKGVEYMVQPFQTGVGSMGPSVWTSIQPMGLPVGTGV